MIPDPEKVRFWQARAEAYDRLCRRWEIFSLLSTRLVELLPQGLEGSVLDIGAGSGLTSQILLARFPHCRPILVDPVQGMLDIARRNLVGRQASFFAMGLDETPARDLHVTAALASVSMQFVDLEPAFATLASVIEPGGHLAFNLWYHHWEETADREGMSGWRAVAEAACREAQLPPPVTPAITPKVKTRMDMIGASRRNDFQLVSEHRDEDLTPVAIGVDFHAMGADWPSIGLPQDVRRKLLQRMHELAQGKFETLISTRFLFQNTSTN